MSNAEPVYDIPRTDNYESLLSSLVQQALESSPSRVNRIAKIEDNQRKLPVATRSNSTLGVAAYSLVALAPAIVATLVDERLTGNGLIHYSMTVTGIIAFPMVALQFVLAARISWIVISFGLKSVMEFHRRMAVVVLLLVLAHVGLLVWSRGNWNLLLNPRASWPILLGRTAIVSLIAIIAFSFCRKRIPINNADWRWFHNALAWLILTSGFAHSVTVGSSFANLAFAVIWTGYFSIAILAWISAKFKS